MSYVPTPDEQARANMLLHMCRYAHMKSGGKLTSAEIVSGVLKFMSGGGTEQEVGINVPQKRGKESSLMKRAR